MPVHPRRQEEAVRDLQGHKSKDSADLYSGPLSPSTRPRTRPLLARLKHVYSNLNAKAALACALHSASSVRSASAAEDDASEGERSQAAMAAA